MHLPTPLIGQVLMANRAASMAAEVGAASGATQHRICQVPGCGRAIHTAGHSKCCSACPLGRHTRRCQHGHWAGERMGPSRCITEGCVHMAGPGHISCCSLCKRTGGQQHTIQCAHRQARHVQRAQPSLHQPTGDATTGALRDDSTRVGARVEVIDLEAPDVQAGTGSEQGSASMSTGVAGSMPNHRGSERGRDVGVEAAGIPSSLASSGPPLERGQVGSWISR